MKKKDVSGSIFLIIIMLAILGGWCFYFYFEIRELKTDHLCYMLDDDEFYKVKKCKPYWSYRQVGKNGH